MKSQFDLQRDGTDVQAIVRGGFKRAAHCRFLLLRIQDPVLVRSWLAQLLDSKLIKTVADENKAEIEEAVVLAFSYAGLRALEVTEQADFPFPTSFTNGMADPAREPLLGDRNRKWKWGDTAAAPFQEVHVLAAHYQSQPFDGTTALVDMTQPEAWGLGIVEVIHTCPYYLRTGTEPFGFKDGIGQPIIAELMKSELLDKRRARGGASFEDDVVKAGEFILGHANSYGERSYSPDVVGWQDFAERSGARFARNGSYMAVRQIEQHVAKFQQYPLADHEKMIGRTQDGKPLVTEPGSPPDPDRHPNDFRYRLADYDGFHCPRGAHIRRANPRDALGWDVRSGVKASKLHRLIRRGRVYTDGSTCDASCGSGDASTGCGNGLFFIALNADLDRQFEFVQQRWFANSKFADLWDETDPLGYGDDRSFSMPGSLPVGRKLHPLPQFTTVKGGGYFFLPGLSALRFMSEPLTHDDLASSERQTAFTLT